jgi:hypothetical protein
MKKLLLFSATALFLFVGCDKEPENVLIKKENLTGHVQKGPFTSGTSITINELSKELTQTGRTYNTQITDNLGGFSINSIELISSYISLKADGFYFNEVSGATSNSQITLYALSDITEKSTFNVNILSHLEKPRVEYLIEQGNLFGDAKSTALSEILSIFDIDTELTQSSETFDISKDGEGNAILLAISVILQGYRGEGELTELLTNIGTDIKEDGILNSSTLGSQLISHAAYLDTLAIRNNLEKRYMDLGVEVDIPNFEKYIANFVQNSTFENTDKLFEYPSKGQYGINILDLEKTVYAGSVSSLAAKLAKNTKLRIKITALNGGLWYYLVGSDKNWYISPFDYSTHTQEFTAIESGKACDLNIQFHTGKYRIDYFEMEQANPTRTKTITI